MTGTKSYYTPTGRFIDIPPPLPRSDQGLIKNPWWLDQGRAIGFVTRKVRKVRIVNMLTRQDLVLEVFIMVKVRYQVVV